ncbi:MAG: S1 RNA-binding domain-containing protein [Chitinophagaceae bacterium]
MIKVGEINTLVVARLVDIGVYLDDNADGILLPKRFVPKDCKIGDTVKAFIYHDGENRLIATTQVPKGVVGDIVKLKVKTTTEYGAFLDNGIMKDIFIPRQKQISRMVVDQEYLVKIEIDKKTGRLVANEKVEHNFKNDVLTIKELEVVQLVIYRKTNIGYIAIINNQHIGLLHENEVYRNIKIGDKFEGFIKKIYPENPDPEAEIKYKIDVALGKMGYKRVEDETEKMLRLLNENNGYLPYHDKSSPEDIYAFFGMSKKTFKMTTGNLFKQRKISFEKDGIRLLKIV